MKITGFGDYLIHFSPQEYERFAQADLLRINFTGAEANVCAALALWGDDVSFVTRLPQNVLADRAVTTLRTFGIDSSHVARGGKRMGAYYLEKGASVRKSLVIYDRDHSAFTEATETDFDFDAILSDTDLLYLTGITPALSESLFSCCLTLCKMAKEKGVKIAYDVNFRPTLLSAQKAGENLLVYAPYLDYLIGNEEHLKQLLGLQSEYGENETEKRVDALIGKVRKKTGIEKIAVTVRRTPSASDAIFSAAYSDGKETVFSGTAHIHVVDRVGSGDAFSAGLLYGLEHEPNTQKTLDFAVASAALKHTVMGDINYSSPAEIASVLDTGFGDVIR